MTDYSKPGEALRCCIPNPPETCVGCTYNTDVGCNVARMMSDAADAIEALQKDLTTLQKCYEIADTTVDKVAKQLPKRGEWIWIQKANGGQYKGCSVCCAPIPTDSMLDYLDDEDCDFCYSCGAKMEVQDD